MRAKEFVINIPIHITMNSDGSVDVNNGSHDDTEEQEDGVMVPPLQQEIELQKASVGKNSPVIDQLTQDEDNDAYRR